MPDMPQDPIQHYHLWRVDSAIRRDSMVCSLVVCEDEGCPAYAFMIEEVPSAEH